MADQKVAAYVCSGCGIGDRLDTKQLVNIATREGKAQLVKQHEFLCGAEGVAMIQKDIEEGVTHIGIAACSRRVKTEAFHFPTTALSRANLREGVIWSQDPEGENAEELTQDMADDYVRMMCAEVKKMVQPGGDPAATTQRKVLVVGGGMAGMTAALEASRAGYQVAIVEATGQLGGFANNLWKRIPVREPYAEPQDTGVDAMVAAVQADKNINVHLNSRVGLTAGAPGRFVVTVEQESGASTTENVGAIIQATGFKTYDIANLPELGGGKSPNVVDQAGLEKLAKAGSGKIKRPSDGGEVKNVVFVQCAGQRDETGKHLPYCSGSCCATSVKQAMYFKAMNPDIDTTVIYTDLRMPGNNEDFYRSAQDKGVIFAKGKVSAVEAAGNSCMVKFQDLILNEEAVIEDADLVVLATGQIANSGVNIDTMPKVEDNAPQEEKDKVAKEIKVMSILNLNYRQGPDMPQLVSGFNDSHFICFPYETRRTGIYACGPVRRPMDMAQAQEDATGAAMKAIQAIENAAIGRAAHPRSGDLSYPSFRKEGCTQCKRCTVECPFGAIDEDEQRYPQFNQARCRRCGTCMGACPVRVISFENYSVETVNSQIKAVDMPDEFSEKPRILVLACENDAYPALDMAGMQKLSYSAFVRVIPVRCLGSTNLSWVTDALSSGYDGVMLMGCKKGVDYQCHFVKGSELAHQRLSKVDDTLKGMNLEAERVQTYEIAITDIQRMPKLINDYAAKIKEIGMSPFKF